MKTAPPSRNRKANLSRPRPFSPHTARSDEGVPAPTPPRPAPGSSATPPGGTVPAEAVTRHSAEAASVEAAAPAAPPAPGRAAFLRSFVYAWHGIAYTVRTQRNMRVHIALGVVAVALGIWLRISPVEFAMVFVAITGVVVSEMINTVAEACVDLATREFHPLAKVAKDVAAGAVLLSAMLAVVIGCFVYIPHLWPLALRLIGR